MLWGARTRHPPGRRRIRSAAHMCCSRPPPAILRPTPRHVLLTLPHVLMPHTCGLTHVLLTLPHVLMPHTCCLTHVLLTLPHVLLPHTWLAPAASNFEANLLTCLGERQCLDTRGGPPSHPCHRWLQAHLAPVRSVAEAKAVLYAIKNGEYTGNADHQICAYRVADDAASAAGVRGGSFVERSDDDGEVGAGRKLLGVLQRCGTPQH